MTALAEAPPLGLTAARFLSVPDGAVSSLGRHCVEWARDTLGVDLFPWQEQYLEYLLAQRADGKWSAPRSGLILPRQNGKTLVLLVRDLYEILVLGNKRVIHSSHDGATARASYGEVVELLENAPGPCPRQEHASGGREHVDFYTDLTSRKIIGTLEFKTRTKSGGRGFSSDLIILDEAQELQDVEIQALNPTMIARSKLGNPQVIYAGSAGDFESSVLARVRRRGIAGAERLLFVEFSIDDERFLSLDPDERVEMLSDPDQRRRANPLYEVRISNEGLSDELSDLGPIGFAREHMGVGSWPQDDSADWLIPRAKWAACADEESGPPVGTVALAIGAAWDRTVSVAVCGAREDGLTYAELTHYGADSVAKIVATVKRMRDELSPCTVVVDEKGPADFLVPDLEAAGIVLEKVSAREVAQACSSLHAVVTEAVPDFRHRGQGEVSAALAGARRKDLGDGWVLDRRRSSADVTPLEVLALARWGFVVYGASSESWGFFE